MNKSYKNYITYNIFKSIFNFIDALLNYVLASLFLFVAVVLILLSIDFESSKKNKEIYNIYNSTYFKSFELCAKKELYNTINFDTDIIKANEQILIKCDKDYNAILGLNIRYNGMFLGKFFLEDNLKKLLDLKIDTEFNNVKKEFEEELRKEDEVIKDDLLRNVNQNKEPFIDKDSFIDSGIMLFLFGLLILI